MLPAAHRLRTGKDFQHTVRGGRKAGSRTLVVHLRLGDDAPDGSSADPARMGLVVSRGVGNAVARNRVKRRLRHLAVARLSLLPAGSVAVVRALPAAAEASSATLGADLDRGLGRLSTASVARAGSPA